MSLFCHTFPPDFFSHPFYPGSFSHPFSPGSFSHPFYPGPFPHSLSPDSLQNSFFLNSLPHSLYPGSLQNSFFLNSLRSALPAPAPDCSEGRRSPGKFPGTGQVPAPACSCRRLQSSPRRKPHRRVSLHAFRLRGLHAQGPAQSRGHQIPRMQDHRQDSLSLLQDLYSPAEHWPRTQVPY